MNIRKIALAASCVAVSSLGGITFAVAGNDPSAVYTPSSPVADQSSGASAAQSVPDNARAAYSDEGAQRTTGSHAVRIKHHHLTH